MFINISNHKNESIGNLLEKSTWDFIQPSCLYSKQQYQDCLKISRQNIP